MRVTSPSDTYEIEQLLSQTGQTRHFKATSVKEKNLVCLKMISQPPHDYEYAFEKEKHEAALIKELHHPLMPHLIEAFEYQKIYVIVTEYFDGKTLTDKLRTGFSENRARYVFVQLVELVDYLHLSGVVHLNLTLDSILLSEEDTVRVIGFHTASEHLRYRKLEKFCQPYTYAPPEIVLNRPYIGNLADTWSLGVILYFLVAGKSPYRSTTNHELIGEVIENKIKKPELMSRQCFDLISHLMDKNPSNRYSPKQIKCHLWMRSKDKYSLMGIKAANVWSLIKDDKEKRMIFSSFSTSKLGRDNGKHAGIENNKVYNSMVNNNNFNNKPIRIIDFQKLKNESYIAVKTD